MAAALLLLVVLPPPRGSPSFSIKLMDASSSLCKHGHASERRRKVAQRQSLYVQEHEDRLELDYSGNEVAREDDVSHGEDIGCDHASDREGDGGGEHIVDEHDEGGEDTIPRAEKPKTKRKPKKLKVPNVLAINGVPMNGPYPRGPKDNSLLTSFYNHVALHVWFGEERGPLKVIHHTKKLKEWVIKPEWSYFSEMLSACGLRNLGDALPLLNKSLISDFVERWHPETSSFHLPVGEMTITLDDVKQITGLSIEGDLLIDFEIGSIEEVVDLVYRCLGVEKKLIRDELKFNNDQMNLRFEWIKKQMSGKEASRSVDSGNESSDEESEEPGERHKTVEFALRGYLLYCLGCNLFSNKTGSKVSISYLRFLENLDEGENYAWGASGLAFLYKALESSSRVNYAQVTGFLALLEEYRLDHATDAEGILASLIQKGKKYYGKVYEDIKKAHEHLVLCGGGAPAPMVLEEENSESDEEERRRASQTKKRRPKKKN